ncbi:SDR family oxidoreductase [Pseudarthrobacter sp. So.54]
MAGAPTLAVTGSTGHLGAWWRAGWPTPASRQRLLVRDPGRAPELHGAVPGIFTYADRILAESALKGVQTLFMVSAAEAEDRLQQHRTFVDAAAAAGVQHIVYTSFFGAAPDCTFTLGRDHFATEEHIRASGMEFTFLRDNFYLDFLPLLAGDDGVIRGPAGQGAMAAVARADIARSAVAVLRDPALHVGRTYSLTGPADISLATAADLLTARTGRTITFQNETLEEAYASRAPFGVARWQVDAWVSTYTAIAAGELAGPTPAVHELTGREPLSLAQLLDDSHKI